jgi:predicted aspartyl protease
MLRVNCGWNDALQGQKALIHYGPELGVRVGFDATYRIEKLGAPKLDDFATVRALVDTGARESCIDATLAEQLKLIKFDRKPVAGAIGVVEVDFYMAQIFVPSLSFTLTGRFAGLPLVACGFRQQTVLGRSFLCYLKLCYDGKTGEVILSTEE